MPQRGFWRIGTVAGRFAAHWLDANEPLRWGGTGLLDEFLCCWQYLPRTWLLAVWTSQVRGMHCPHRNAARGGRVYPWQDPFSPAARAASAASQPQAGIPLVRLWKLAFAQNLVRCAGALTSMAA